MAETSTIFGFMKYVSATDILSDFKKTVDSYFVDSLKLLVFAKSFLYVFYIFFSRKTNLEGTCTTATQTIDKGF